MKIKIFSAYYGVFDKIIETEIITPVQGGAVICDNKKIRLKDSIFPEISKKNEFYSELSVLFSVWKEYSKNLDYIGLCHYGRYFVSSKMKYFYEIKNRIRLKINNEKIIEKATNDIEKEIINYDGIIPKLKKINVTIKEHYEKEHIKEHYEVYENVIKENFEFLRLYLDYTSNRKVGYFLNMFILKKDIFNEYCRNLFQFLEIIEKKIEIPKKKNYQKRALGFLVERFTNLYFIYLKEKNIKLKEMPIINIK